MSIGKTGNTCQWEQFIVTFGLFMGFDDKKTIEYAALSFLPSTNKQLFKKKDKSSRIGFGIIPRSQT